MTTFLNITMSLDGYVAGPNQTLDEPLGAGGEDLHEWMLKLESWRQAHGLEGGETNDDEALVRRARERTGAYVMGRRMFSNGEGPWDEDPKANGWWGDDPPFGTDVFVVTHHAREPLELGDTTFRFVEGVEAAVEQARAAAGQRDVQVAGGAAIAQQALDAGLLDELYIHVAPQVLAGGVRLFDNLQARRLPPALVQGSPSGVVHLTYRVT